MSTRPRRRLLAVLACLTVVLFPQPASSTYAGSAARSGEARVRTPSLEDVRSVRARTASNGTM